MPYYQITTTFKAEDEDVLDSVLAILDNTLPYMVDNVTTEVKEV